MSVEKKGFLAGVKYDDPLVVYRGRKVKRLAELIAGRELKVDPSLTVDLFYIFYLPAPILRRDVDREQWEYVVLESLASSRTTTEVRGKTLLDPFLSALAAGLFVAELGHAAEPPAGHRVEKIRFEDAEHVRAAVEKALSSTLSDIESIQVLKDVAGGFEPGSSSSFSLEEHGVEVLKLARDADVKRILAYLRGVKPWELGVERRRKRFKHGEISGYEHGRDFERISRSSLLLPDELFYLRYLQGKLLLYEKIVEESQGPIYVLLDKCIPAGSKVIRGDGEEIDISRVEPGDTVLSPLAGGLRGAVEAEVVEKVSAFKPAVAVKTEVSTLKASPDHIVPVAEGGAFRLLQVSQLRPGDRLLYYHAKKEAFVEAVVKEFYWLGESVVYDLRLRENHYYIADGFVVHNSGSMEGLKIDWAKAVALALYAKASRSGREFYLRFFDSQPYELIKLSRRADPSRVLEAVRYIARVRGSGGTDISRAIIMATIDIRRRKVPEESDIVLITDGIDRVMEETVRHNLRKADTRLITVMIHGDNQSLRKVSHKYFSVKQLDTTGLLTVVEA